MKRVILICLLVAATTPFLVISGCKQGDGERCQVNEDCDSLQCNQAEGKCSSGTDKKPADANLTDSPPPDAAVDAPVD